MFEGTTTHRFIESSPYYPQFGYYGFAQTKINNRFFLHDCTKLRDFFNNKFNEIYVLKEREMNVIRDRIERIRYIDSELNIMFNKHVPHVPTDPVWHWQVLHSINNSSSTRVPKRILFILLQVRMFVE